MIRTLAKFNDPVLRSRTTNYMPDELDDAIALSVDLFDTMKKYNGIGLSANQIGINRNMFVISIDGIDKIFINPCVIQSSSETEKQLEGCLSLPGLHLPVSRPITATVSWIDENKISQISNLEGLYCRVFLHELDHSFGILIDDRVSKLVLNMAKKRLIKKIKRSYK